MAWRRRFPSDDPHHVDLPDRLPDHRHRSGKIGLPELQRPFAGPDTSGRDLFGPLHKDHPTGGLQLGETGADGEIRASGASRTQMAAKLAIVDGQPRLSRLRAMTTGAEVPRADVRRGRIRIAFRPLLQRVAVADAAHARGRATGSDVGPDPGARRRGVAHAAAPRAVFAGARTGSWLCPVPVPRRPR